MDDDAVLALATDLADLGGTAGHGSGDFTLWLDRVPAEHRVAVGDWAYRNGGIFMQREIILGSTQLATGTAVPDSEVPARWLLPLEALRR